MALSLIDTKPKKETGEDVEVASSEAEKKEEKPTKSKKTKTKKVTKKSSKKKSPKKKETKKKDGKPLGPQERVFYGKKITRFYADDKWYYNLEDILAIGAVGDQKSFLKEMKEEDLYDEVFKDGINKIEVLDQNTEEMVVFNCIDKDVIIKLVRVSGKPFPGPMTRWITEVSQDPYEEPQKAKASTSSSTSASSPPQTG